MTDTPVQSPRIIDVLARLQRWGQGHPLWFYTVPLVTWIVFLSWAELAPPRELPQINIPQFDKVEHALCYSILAALLLRGWVRNARPTRTAAVVVWVAVATWGYYLEVMQGLTGYRSYDLWDAFFNALGALFGLLLWLRLERRLRAVLAPSTSDPDDHESEESAR